MMSSLLRELLTYKYMLKEQLDVSKSFACCNVLLRHACHNVLFKIGKHACHNGLSKCWQTWLLLVWHVFHMLRKDWYSYLDLDWSKLFWITCQLIRIVDLYTFKIWQAPFLFLCLRRPDINAIQRYCDCVNDYQTCYYILVKEFWWRARLPLCVWNFSDGHTCPYVLFKSVLMGTLTSLCCSSVLVTGRLDI